MALLGTARGERSRLRERLTGRCGRRAVGVVEGAGWRQIVVTLAQPATPANVALWPPRLSV